ncbi:MAG: lysophospholipid acyltransferase family protein [Cyclobacteriaceae bacterium]|nr:lysophospholipid acyltransferase family protein [Cyclobacteriaceae bacterium]
MKLGFILIKLFSLLPFWVLYTIANFLGFLMYHVFGYRKEVVLNNLRNSFPNKSEKEIHTIAKKFYRSFSDTIISSIKSFTISEKEIRKRFVYKNPEIFQRHLDEGRNILGMCGHYSNWEWTFSSPLFFSSDIETILVYQKLQNKFFNKIILDSRERFGSKFIPTHRAYATMLNKENNGKYIFGLVADQSPHKTKIKHWLTFLNQDTPVHLGSENIARNKDYAVVFCNVHQVKRGYYEMVLEDMFDHGASTSEYEITTTFFKKLEKIIEEKPEEWLWSHRRWKHSRN